MAEEFPNLAQGEHADENGAPRGGVAPALETQAGPEGISSPARDVISTGSGPRRNTVTRRHSPSTTSLDQAPIRDEMNANAKKTLPELTERFESIRAETDEVIALIGREEAESRKLLEELEAEKQEKRGKQKEKEEQTERLKKDVNSAERTMRNALQRKEKKEKLLKERQADRAKYHENMEKWERQMEDMRKNQDGFDQQRRDLEEERSKKSAIFRESNSELQVECAQLETELRDKREQVKALEEERKLLTGGEEDGEWLEKKEELRREGMKRTRELQETLALEAKHARKLEEQLRALSMHIQHIPQTTFSTYTQPSIPAPDFDNPTVTQLKRRSRNSNSLSNISISSPLPPYSQIDPAASIPGFSSRPGNVTQGFAPGPFMDLSTDLPPRLDEAGIRGSSAPLSPSATALLPSNILDDFEDDDPTTVPGFAPDPFLPQHRGSPDNDPQSPASSGRSMSILGSPHGSTHNLPFPPYQNDVDRRINTGAMLPSGADAPPNKLIGFFSFQRAQTTKVGAEMDGPMLGTLKQGQSQSFPRQTDEPDAKRRISLSSTWSMFNRNSAGPDVLEAHAPNSRMFSARSLNPFSSSHRAPGGLLAERDANSPRPASIASSDFPRPSTDSGSIWGPPIDPSGLGKPRNLWSPDTWSRNPSRRPSLHGSPSQLKTTLASADDEILDEDDAMPDVKEVGVIGSRPPQNSKAAIGRLNPNAPAFIGALFKPKSEKDKEAKDKGKAKDSHKSKDKTKDKSKGKEIAVTPGMASSQSLEIESPSDSRKSRDGYSVHTQTSVSESRDSLSLDQSFSNTPSEPTSAGLAGSVKDDNVVRKLFRKSSSGKFSLPGRLGGKESSLFKKGPSSVASGANSDKGFPMERSSIGDFEEVADDVHGSFVARSYDSVTSSPGLGPASGVKARENKAPGRWLSTFGKKGKKEKESLDLDRSQVSESEATDDGMKM
ncbi:hypothetical protein OQA88_4159 [Cercophora sp. LCS_1]